MPSINDATLQLVERTHSFSYTMCDFLKDAACCFFNNRSIEKLPCGETRIMLSHDTNEHLKAILDEALKPINAKTVAITVHTQPTKSNQNDHLKRHQQTVVYTPDQRCKITTQLERQPNGNVYQSIPYVLERQPTLPPRPHPSEQKKLPDTVDYIPMGPATKPCR